MEAQNLNYFVIAATVSAELYKAMRVAKEISLTASNARALALRAGQSAAGFRAITDFIDELATITVNSSKNINRIASQLSRTASETARAEDALQRFNLAKAKAPQAAYLQSIETGLNHTLQQKNALQITFDKQTYLLRSELETIANELRKATVLSAMSRIEASQTSPEYSQQLDVVATNVAAAAADIQSYVRYSQALFAQLTRN